MNDFKEYSIVISKLDTGYEVPTDLKIWNNYVGYENYLGAGQSLNFNFGPIFLKCWIWNLQMIKIL